MKTLFIMIALLISTSYAFAAEKRIELHRTLSRYYSSYSANYVINSELGRIWIEVNGNSSDPDISSDTFRIKLKNLVFDAATNEISYNDNGTMIVCANLRPQINFFKPERIFPTNNCSFVTRTERKQVDDGFEINTKSYDILDLVIID